MGDLVVGNPVLVFGDIHYSAIFQGAHKDYYKECLDALSHITSEIQTRKPSALVLLGDIIGWNESNIKDHQALHILLKVFKLWNETCPVYVVTGNHDIKGHPDFVIFNDLGLFRTATNAGGYIDYKPTADSEVSVRFHLLDYGNEKRQLDILPNCSNLILSHNGYTIEGITNWFPQNGCFELGTFANFEGCEGVIAGHIHTPSPDYVETTLPNNEKIWLFYPGCPTRPQRDTYNRVWEVAIGYNSDVNMTDVQLIPWELAPYEDVFIAESVTLNEMGDEALAEVERQQALSAIIDDLLKYNITAGDPIQQVEKIPNASEDAKTIAVEYLNKVLNQGA